MCTLPFCVIKKEENGTTKALVIQESFLGFHEVEDKTAIAISYHIIEFLNEKNISLKKDREKGYDDSNNMKGIIDVEKGILGI